MCLSRQLYGGLKDVMVPEMYEAQTTRRVLIMQWVEVFPTPYSIFLDKRRNSLYALSKFSYCMISLDFKPGR